MVETRRLRTLLIGGGSLGRAFLRRAAIKDSPVNVVGILTAHHGRRFSAEGIDPLEIVSNLETEGLGEDGPNDVKKAIEQVRPEVVVECVPQNIRSGEPSLTFLRTALDAGAHVITTNKSAIALGYRDLRHRAAKANVTFRFEATVLDGLPLFSWGSRLPPNTKIKRARGVLNGTSSLVLESVQNGSTRSRGLARAQAQGIAESDAVLDVDGWDAAAKAALLANVWMGGALRVVDVVREGCELLKDEELRRAAPARYRLVADIVRTDEGAVRASVKPIALEPNDPLYSLPGAAGGIFLETSVGSFSLLQNSHGLEDAAQGVLNDFYAILENAPQV
ncbi:MAG: hypothetical protein U1E65_34750 [Myxococcota bacterium]